MGTCSVGQLKYFKEGSLWGDIVVELNIRISNLQSVLEDPDCALSIDTLRMTQGGIRSFKEVRDNLLDVLIDTASEEREERNG